jgi:putative membrane protein
MMFHPIFGLFGLIFPLGILLIIVLVVWALTSASRHAAPYPPPPPLASPPASRETPLDILARRFASGEINAEEYQKARDLLKGDSTTGR